MSNESVGFPLRIVKGEVDHQKFICIKCKLILRNPYQGFCGHRYCKSCLQELINEGHSKCPFCEEEGITDEDNLIGPDKTFPDNAIRREMSTLQVVCLVIECTWEGRYRDIEAHLSLCPYIPVLCLNCQNKIPRSKMEAHLASKCGTIDLEAFKCPFGCEDTILDQASLDMHEKEKFVGHLRSLSREIKKALLNTSGLKTFSASTGEQDNFSEACRSPDIMRIQNLEGAVVVLSKDLSSICDKLAEFERLQYKTEEELRKTQGLEKQILKQEARISELQTTITALEKCTYDGLLIWKIDHFSGQRESAMNGQITSIYSPHFYTSKTGYKICSRIYLNGDGMGKGTHISIFFVLMRGPYDAILVWPFNIPVKFELMDVIDGKDSVVDIFRPDPTSSSFKKPTTSMNIASGCPTFISLTDFELKRQKYLRDDAIFIKIEVSHQLLNNER